MVTPRHHIWGYGGYHYGYHRGCYDAEDWVINPRCCDQYGYLDFDDADSCREYYDNIDIRSLLIWEWLMGALFIGGIALTFILCCCWRRGNNECIQNRFNSNFFKGSFAFLDVRTINGKVAAVVRSKLLRNQSPHIKTHTPILK